MKFLDTDNGSIVVDEVDSTVTIYWTMTSPAHAQVQFTQFNRSRSIRECYTVFATDRMTYPINPPMPGTQFRNFVARLVRARLVAKLAAPHVTHILDDHAEFVRYTLLEQVAALAEMTSMPEQYSKDWEQTVSARVTGGTIQVGGAVYPRQELIKTRLLQSTTNRADWSVTANYKLRHVTMYHGPKDHCIAALRFLENTPLAESITPIQLRRYVARHVPVDTPETPEQVQHNRVVVLPE